MTRLSRRVVGEINRLVASLIKSGLADDQNNAYEKQQGSTDWLVGISGINYLGSSLKDVPYVELYGSLRESRSFNVRMLDGALIQLIYEFRDSVLLRHRLAYFPSPDLMEFQNDPGLYEQERIYADVISKSTVTVPLRFDFDARPGVPVSALHPVSHLTLGQYDACRIPVSAGVSPTGFFSFLLHSFYSKGTLAAGLSIPSITKLFPATISSAEQKLVHIAVPCLKR